MEVGVYPYNVAMYRHVYWAYRFKQGKRGSGWSIRIVLMNGIKR
jgi:hypothetical protein